MIRIRGIYATALAGLLSDAGYGFSDVSDKTRERIPGIRVSKGGARVTVKDLEHHKGIMIVGGGEEFLSVYSLLHATLDIECSVVIKDGPYTVYRARVLESTKGGYIVELPARRRGYLRTFRTHYIGEPVTVHVVKPDLISPVLEEGVALSGDYVRIIEGGRHSVSEHIRDPQLVLELLTLASSYATGGWGVRFRSSSRSSDMVKILEELKSLVEEAKKVKARADKAQDPVLLREGESIAFVYFSTRSFDALDIIRRKYYPTGRSHHLVKSLGNEQLSNLVDEVEGKQEGVADFFQLYLDELKRVLSEALVRIVHEKPIGRGYSWQAKPLLTPEGFIRLEREIQTPGKYDGLNIGREKGDRIVTLAYPFSRFLLHQYFDREGNLKGIYVNLNTPLDVTLSPPGLWYLDVFLDVVWTPGEEPRIVDRAQFELLRATGLYPNVNLERYLDSAESLREILSKNPSTLLENPRTMVDLQERLWHEKTSNILDALKI